MGTIGADKISCHIRMYHDVSNILAGIPDLWKGKLHNFFQNDLKFRPDIHLDSRVRLYMEYGGGRVTNVTKSFVVVVQLLHKFM